MKQSINISTCNVESNVTFDGEDKKPCVLFEEKERKKEIPKKLC